MCVVFVFISHSRYDEQIKNFFSHAIARTNGLNGTFMEFENLEGAYAGVEISNKIRHPNTACLIVLLGENIESAPGDPVYTHNWVNFEVGVAAGYGKPVWVFEEYRDDIHFPIPYVTDYCQYQIGNNDFLRYIGNTLIGSMLSPPHRRTPQVRIHCHFCHAEYNYWNDVPIERCPVCRQPTTQRRNKIDLRLSNVV